MRKYPLLFPPAAQRPVIFKYISSFWQRRTRMCSSIVFLKCSVIRGCSVLWEPWLMAGARYQRPRMGLRVKLLEGRTAKHSVTDVSGCLWSSRFWWPGHRPVPVRHQHMQVWWGVSKNWEHGDVHLRLQGKTWCFSNCYCGFPLLVSMTTLNVSLSFILLCGLAAQSKYMLITMEMCFFLVLCNRSDSQLFCRHATFNPQMPIHHGKGFLSWKHHGI